MIITKLDHLGFVYVFVIEVSVAQLKLQKFSIVIK